MSDMVARMLAIQAEWERSERLDLETPLAERCPGSLRATGDTP